MAIRAIKSHSLNRVQYNRKAWNYKKVQQPRRSMEPTPARLTETCYQTSYIGEEHFRRNVPDRELLLSHLLISFENPIYHTPKNTKYL